MESRWLMPSGAREVAVLRAPFAPGSEMPIRPCFQFHPAGITRPGALALELVLGRPTSERSEAARARAATAKRENAAT